MMGRLQRTVEPTAEPVTLTELKSHLRVEDNTDDDLITGLGIAARDYVEKQTSRQIMPATFTLTLDSFPGGDGIIELPRPPFKAT